MKLKICLLFVNPILFSASAFAQTENGTSVSPTIEQRIAEAVLPLPPNLRDASTVIAYTSGIDKTTLRSGTNEIICEADPPTPRFAVLCYHESVAWFSEENHKLAAQGQPRPEWARRRIAGLEDGTFPIPPYGATIYILRGPNIEQAAQITAVLVPHATAKTTGLQTTPDTHRPWLMNPGTPWAHVMLPGM